MEDKGRVISMSKYKYYTYYKQHKEKYIINYQLKKDKDQLEEKHKKYMEDYWRKSLWKPENMKLYKKNNI